MVLMVSFRPKAAYYAVASGRNPGVYTTWTEAEAQVKGYAGAKYKKFPSLSQAKEFISGSGPSPLTSSTSSTSTSKNNKPYSKPPTSTSNSTAVGFNTHHRAESPTTLSSSSDLPPDLQIIASRGYEFTKDHYLIVHTDGSALGNGQKGSRAGAGVFWGGYGEALKKNYSERVPGLPQTNNRGELLAVIRALEQCPYPDIPLEIRCDSQYTISCMTTWLPKWLRNGFTTSTNNPYSRPNGSSSKQVQKQKQISNVDMVKHLLVLLRRRSGKGRVKFKYVPAHSGIEGNERADQLAKMGSLMPESSGPVKWLTPEEDDDLSLDLPKSTTGVEGVKQVTDIEVELDENWLMSPEELENFEKDLIDESNEG
ncbi:hypothetical protein L486_03929 [Kwoniella mangroviensis CBS 10435]|uniref:Ribonuclease H n=1 Tax=Kwoniella mangroviensis CBS 10435 TaxID=1331196 RepID=A0A1B9IQW6_9TREE|nr:hypothetical protein L486_03929 [Kwoniella mangroviensis CBS 10435]